MQTTPAPATAPDLAAQFTANLLQAHNDALQTLHKLMLQAADGLTKPTGDDEEPSRASTITQRMRLCFQMAREILRVRAPRADGSEADWNRKTRSRHPAFHQSASERMKAALSSSLDPDERANGTHSTEAAPLLATAGTTLTRTGEQTAPLPDSAPSTQGSALSVLAPEAPAHDTARPGDESSPAAPARAKRDMPKDLTHLERLEYYEAHQRRAHFPLDLYLRFVEWYHYTQATGEPAPFGMTLQELKRRRPPNGPDPEVAP